MASRDHLTWQDYIVLIINVINWWTYKERFGVDPDDHLFFTVGETIKLLDEKGIVISPHQVEQCFKHLVSRGMLVERKDKKIVLPKKTDERIAKPLYDTGMFAPLLCQEGKTHWQALVVNAALRTRYNGKKPTHGFTGSELVDITGMSPSAIVRGVLKLRKGFPLLCSEGLFQKGVIGPATEWLATKGLPDVEILASIFVLPENDLVAQDDIDSLPPPRDAQSKSDALPLGASVVGWREDPRDFLENRKHLSVSAAHPPVQVQNNDPDPSCRVSLYDLGLNDAQISALEWAAAREKMLFVPWLVKQLAIPLFALVRRAKDAQEKAEASKTALQAELAKIRQREQELQAQLASL